MADGIDLGGWARLATGMTGEVYGPQRSWSDVTRTRPGWGSGTDSPRGRQGVTARLHPWGGLPCIWAQFTTAERDVRARTRRDT